MLHLDLFDALGNLKSEEGLFEGNDSAMEVTHIDGASPDLNPTLAPYFQIPQDILHRVVKNKVELSTLQKIGDLSVQLDKIVERLSPSNTLLASVTIVRHQMLVALLQIFLFFQYLSLQYLNWRAVYQFCFSF